MVGAFVIGYALLLVVGCAETRSESPKQQGHTEATREQTRSAKAASEEARCAETQPIDRHGPSGRWVTNNVPGCPKGGPLSGTDKPDELDGLDGDDEIRGLGAKDSLIGGLGSDVIYGGAGNDVLIEPVRRSDAAGDVFYGGDDRLAAGKGEDVMYGGDGNHLLADKNDYVSSSCEKKYPPMMT